MSGPRVFVTGGGGFVGRHLLRALSASEEWSVIALDRTGRLEASGVTGVRVVRGDLTEPSSYREELTACRCVIHLAAATGKASADSQRRDTLAGTETLLATSRQRGVSAFLFMSSIAASFSDTRDYPYAVAKAGAERAVASSGMRFTILRPTMILGDGSPILKSLTALALLPRIVVPGTGRVRVQPVCVDDIVGAIVHILRHDRFVSETLEIGGPVTVTMEALLQRIRVLRTGRAGGVVHIPLGPVQGALRVAERLGLGRFLPATSGQLTSFRQEGVARPNSMQAELESSMVDLEHMLTAARGA